MNQSQETKSAGDDKFERNDRDIRKTVRNLKRDTKLADKLEVAGSGPKRSKGLLGRSGLGPGEGLWIIPCEAVHTFFMQFSIDLVYLDRQYRVKKICARLPAWRLSACLSAHSVLELPAGTIQESMTQVGDILEIVATEPVAGQLLFESDEGISKHSVLERNEMQIQQIKSSRVESI